MQIVKIPSLHAKIVMIQAMPIPISMFALIVLIITQFLPIPLNFRLLFSVFKKNNISYLNLVRITFPQVI